MVVAVLYLHRSGKGREGEHGDTENEWMWVCEHILPKFKPMWPVGQPNPLFTSSREDLCSNLSISFKFDWYLLAAESGNWSSLNMNTQKWNDFFWPKKRKKIEIKKKQTKRFFHEKKKRKFLFKRKLSLWSELKILLTNETNTGEWNEKSRIGKNPEKSHYICLQYWWCCFHYRL